nr:hypothetical protein [Tanacetum cinerariifolium]
MAYKEYYACATGEASPKPKASSRRKRGCSDSSTTPPTPIVTPTSITTVVAVPRLTAAAKGKQPARTTSPTDPSEVERTEAEQLKIVLRRSRQETHISQHGGFYTDEGTGSKPWVLDVPSDDSEEEISWNSSDDEDVDAQDKDRDDDEGKKNDESDDGKDDDDDDNDDGEEIPKIDEPKDTESGGDDEETKSDGESEDEKTREEEEESFDPIPRTPKDSEDNGNGDENQGLRISEEERIHEEEEADELYRGVDINQGRGLQVSQDIKDSHMTLTPVHSDGQQESLRCLGQKTYWRGRHHVLYRQSIQIVSPRTTGDQVPEDDLDNMQVKSEEGTLELEDPQELLGSIMLETFLALGFLEYTNVTTGVSVLLTIRMGSLGGTIVGVAILVKGHTFTTSVNIRPMGFHMRQTDLNTFPVVFQTFLFTDEVAFESTTLSLFKLDLMVLSDPLALETKFTHVKENTGVLESKFIEGGVVTIVLSNLVTCAKLLLECASVWAVLFLRNFRTNGATSTFSNSGSMGFKDTTSLSTALPLSLFNCTLRAVITKTFS